MKSLKRMLNIELSLRDGPEVLWFNVPRRIVRRAKRIGELEKVVWQFASGLETRLLLYDFYRAETDGKRARVALRLKQDTATLEDEILNMNGRERQ